MMSERPPSSKGKQSSTKRSRKPKKNSSNSDDDVESLLATKRLLGRAKTRASGTSSQEDKQTTTGPHEAIEKRPTAEPGERATTSAKSTNVTKIRPSDYETATAYTIAQKTEAAENRLDEDETKRATLEESEQWHWRNLKFHS